MGKGITHFMWKWQPHYRIGRELSAKGVFQLLDDRYEPEVFVVGILSEERDDRFPACVEPEDGFWIPSGAFNGVHEIAKEFLAQYPEAKLMHSHVQAQEWHDEGLFKRSIKDAIGKIIDEHQDKPIGVSYYVSLPARVDCFWVSIVVGLQDGVTNEHPRLTKDKVEMHEYRQVGVPVSLIEATMSEFLADSTEELLKPDPGCDHSSPNKEEIIRKAGNRLMTGVVWRVDQRRIEGMYNAFGACTTISSLHYEKAAGSGSILLARKEHPSLNTAVTFASPAKLSDFRKSRKLLELTSQGLPLHCDTEEVFGLVSLGEYDHTCEDLFEVQVQDHHDWKLLHSGKPLMRVQYGQPSLPALGLHDEKLRADLTRLFKSMTPANVDRFIRLVNEARQEPHGTMLVITEAAAAEAERLKTQATPLSPCELTPSLLRSLTPIDGGLLIDPSGICHAIGVILDGMATDRGNPGRGARFNSALRYVESSEAPCLAIVLSEDGGIDLVPDLRPALKRSEIDAAIAALTEIRDAEQINRSSYADLVEWLGQRRFYLRQEDCNNVNSLVKEIDRRLDSEDPGNLKIIRQPLVPHPDMDEELYLIPE